MIEKSQIKVGDSVHYQPDHYKETDRWENGVVKVIREDIDDAVWVVYNCAGEWHRFQDYTGCKTSLEDLNLGWR